MLKLKETYILLSGILAVVTSVAVKDTIICLLLYMLDVVCIRKSIPLYDYIPILLLYLCLGMVLYLFSLMIYAIQDLLLLLVLSVAVIEGSARPSVTNRYPIVDILCLISVEIAFSLLSNVRLHGMDTKPQAIASL